MFTSMLSGSPLADQSFCHCWISSWAAFVFLTAITTWAPASASCLWFQETTIFTIVSITWNQIQTKQFENKHAKIGEGIFDLAVCRPMPLVEPVTMQVKWVRGGRGSGLGKWEDVNLWKRNSWNTQIHPLIHSIHPKPSFFFFFCVFVFILRDQRSVQRRCYYYRARQKHYLRLLIN